MPEVYYKMFRVPKWIVIKNCRQQAEVLGFFQEARNRTLKEGDRKEPILNIVEWPSVTFKDTLMKLRNQGWKPHLPKSLDGDFEPFILHPQLAIRAFAEHLRKKTHTNANVSLNVATQRLERKIHNQEELQRYFDTVLESHQVIDIAQMFQIKEKCFSESGRDHPVWVTTEPCNLNIISSLSDSVLTIGDTKECDINIKKVKPENLYDFLVEKLS